MSLIIPPGYGSAAFILTGPDGTQPYITTMGLAISGFGGDWVAAANSAFLAFEQECTPYINTNLTFDRVSLAIGADGPSGSVDSDLPPAECTATGAFAPTAMSAIIRKNTTVLGRRGRGRMFFPGVMQEVGVDPNGSITITFRDALQTMADAFLLALETGVAGGDPVPPVLLHSGPGAPPPTSVTSLAVGPTVGWIRGRIW